jgi:hypothetical protein
MKAVTEAIETIRLGYSKTLTNGYECFICQLTNNHKGFNTWEIDAIKQQLSAMAFSIPTHISILPVGNQTSSKKLYDGLTTIYCNSQELQNIIYSMQQRNLSA